MGKKAAVVVVVPSHLISADASWKDARVTDPLFFSQFVLLVIRMKREKREEIVRKGVVERERLGQLFEKQEKELRRQYDEHQKRFDEEKTKVRTAPLAHSCLLFPVSKVPSFLLMKAQLAQKVISFYLIPPGHAEY